jgi:hypothetical protein
MPVEIKHKQLGDVKTVSYEEYFHNVNKNLWEIIRIYDLAELYNSKTGPEVWQATLELNQAIEAVKRHPDIFRYEISNKNTQAFLLVGKIKSVFRIIKTITPKAITSLTPIWKLIIVIITGVIAKVVVDLIYTCIK